MSVFAYTALESNGQKTSGTLTADNRTAAIAQVVERGLHPVTVEEDAASRKRAAAKTEASVARPGKVSSKQIESFTRELSNLLSGGVPLARALSLLKRESSNPAAKFLWTAIHEDVTGGVALADAMAKYPQSFSNVYVAMVRAGEAGGFLEMVLGQIAEFRAREADLKGKVKSAMVYPVMLAFLAVGVMVFLLTFFIPRFQTMFKEFGGNLPALTQFIIGASNLLKNYGLFVLIAVIVGVVVLKRAAATEGGRRNVEMAILKTPGVGAVIASFAMVRFCRMLGTLTGSGVPLVSSLKVAREAIGNQTLADTVSHAIEQVQRGTALSKALADTPMLFPPAVVEMIAVAEETGRLDKELVRLSASYEGELDRKLRLLVSVAEPLMLFLMAGLIGTVVVGMLLPIFNLQDLIK